MPRGRRAGRRRAEETVEKKVYLRLEDLPSVGNATAQKLREIGYSTIEALATATVSELAAAGIGEKRAAEIISAAREAIEVSWVTAKELAELKKTVGRITTGSKSLDKLIGGGVETQSITEFFGEYGSGKCVAKGTYVAYMNPDKIHLEPIESIYERYKAIYGERPYRDGYIIPLKDVKVFSLTDKGVIPIEAKFMYRGWAEKLIEIRTERGRELKATPTHKLLTINSDGELSWIEAEKLRPGAPIAVPGKMMAENPRDEISLDDAYFIGLFIAEGTPNPLSISTGSQLLRDWLIEYLRRRFGFNPTIEERGRVFRILLRRSVKNVLGELVSCRAEEKFIPEKIINGSGDVIRYFLAGYLDGDGYVSNFIEISTKSCKLASQLTYLLSRLGVEATLREKEINGERYFRLFITGDGRKLVRTLPLKLKAHSIKTRNSAHGVPSVFIRYLRRTFMSISTHRGCLSKKMKSMYRGKTIGDLLVKNGWRNRRVINRETLMNIRELFINLRDNLKGIESMLQCGELTDNLFRDIYQNLPFAIRPVLKERLELAKSSVGNYVVRGLPKDPARRDFIRRALLEVVKEKLNKLEEALKKLDLVMSLSWDFITEIREIDYHDYVYDFAVPDAGNFIGGNLPTVLHNSQICHQLAVNVQLPPEKGGLNGAALYIDTENTFRIERIMQMAKHVGLDPDEACERIIYAEAYNSDHQVLLLEKADRVIKENNVRLIIIDSLTSHFRSEYVGRQNLPERQQKLNKHMHKLLKLARAFNAAAVVTNQVMARPDEFFSAMAVLPVGGHVVGHVSHTRAVSYTHLTLPTN